MMKYCDIYRELDKQLEKEYGLIRECYEEQTDLEEYCEKTVRNQKP